jgi:hypothetical protein
MLHQKINKQICVFSLLIKWLFLFKMAPPKKHAQKAAKAMITKQAITLYTSLHPQGMSSIC